MDEEKRFTLDVDAADSDAILCLLKAIQDCLGLIPAVTKEYHAALMEALASAAEEGKMNGPWYL